MNFFNYLIKHKSFNVLNKEIGPCLSTNPHNLTFWNIAAYNEFENKGNALTARTFLQKCLRMNKNNIEAYINYFNFELKFLQKIVERRNILLGNENKLKILDTESKEQEDERPNEAEANEGSNQEDKHDEVLKLRIPEIVYRKALEQFKGKETEISLKFLENLYKNGKDLNIKDLKHAIKEIITQNLANKEDSVKMILTSLEKYDDKNFFKHCFRKVGKVENENINLALKLVLKKIEQRFDHIDLKSVEKEHLLQFIINNIEKIINLDQIFESSNFENIEILEYLLKLKKDHPHLIFKVLTEENLTKYFQNNNLITKLPNIFSEFLFIQNKHDSKATFEQICSKLTNNKNNKSLFFSLINIIREVNFILKT